MSSNPLLAYQTRWISDRCQVKVALKSRRTGYTWSSACEAVLEAAGNKGSTLYISYKESLAKEFIATCATWCRAFNHAFSESVEFVADLDPETGSSKNITAFSIEFANGRRILGLSGNPRSLRGMQANVVIDEFAHLDNPDAFLESALALLMWGSRLSIISTPNGAENPFARLCDDVESGRLPYSLHRCTLDDALADGLYQRICQVNGTAWSSGAEAAWRANLIASYGRAAEQELFCVHARSAAQLFRREWFPIVGVTPSPIVRSVRAWDLAGTEVKGKTHDPDYTRGIKGSLLKSGALLIMDVQGIRASPGLVRKLMISTASIDGKATQVAVWQDPGQAGKAQTDDLVARLAGYSVSVERAAKSKVEYATPVSADAEGGKIFLLQPTTGPDWIPEFLSELEAFPRGAHDDQVDALSRLHLALRSQPFVVGYDSPRTLAAHDDDPFWGNNSSPSSCF